jgi:5-methylcytosine-specific restriction endonuclease McrA
MEYEPTRTPVQSLPPAPSHALAQPPDAVPPLAFVQSPLSPESLDALTDDELIRRLGELVSGSRRVEAALVAHIAEVDLRRLYAREACPSMFVYCTERLHLSEAEAYLRITVARAAREHPQLLTMLGDGRLHLSGIALLLPLLTAENRDTLLARATHRSKRQIQELVAELSPRPDAPALMRRLPQSQPAATGPSPDPLQILNAGLPATPGATGGGLKTLDEQLRPDGVVARRAAVEPLSPGRYKVQFTASAALHDKLERLQALMLSEVPDGDLAAIIEKAVSEKLERLEARRYARTSAPRKRLLDSEISPASRHVPAAVRRAVLERHGNRCGYFDEQGRRCPERDRLEFHHRHPFAMGGDHRPENVGLLCRAHNRLIAEHDYGRSAMSRPRRPPETPAATPE